MKRTLGVLGIALGLAYFVYGPGFEPGAGTGIGDETVASAVTPPTSKPIEVAGEGLVIPAVEVTIQPKIAGRVLRHHAQLRPGGYLTKGQEIVTLEPAVMAEGSAESSRHTPSARRRARAGARGAQGASNRILAPFNAMVAAEFVTVGRQVTPASKLARLVGTDAYLVVVDLSIEALDPLRRPGSEEVVVSQVVVEQAAGSAAVRFEGRVVGRRVRAGASAGVVQIVVEVPDPLGLGPEVRAQPLFLGGTVQVKLFGPSKPVARGATPPPSGG